MRSALRWTTRGLAAGAVVAIAWGAWVIITDTREPLRR